MSLLRNGPQKEIAFSQAIHVRIQKSFLDLDRLPLEEIFVPTLVLLLLFLGGLMGMDGFRLVMGSEAPMGRVKEAELHRGEIDQTEGWAQGPHSSWNVYFEWNEPGFFREQIFKELRAAERPDPISFFPHGFFGGTEPEYKYALLDEGEPPFPDTSRKGSSKSRQDWAGIGRDTAFFLGYQVVFAGVLWLLPESVTAWTEDQKKATLAKWRVNVQNPVWDKDKFWINYLAHPYFGGTYYIRARERGFGEFGSFSYSALLSALYEFGIEAFFEPPSLNDLIATPVGGYIVGKFIFEPIRDKIKAKPQLKWYDHAGLFLTDPLGAINSVFERLLGIESDIRVQFHSPDVGREMTRDPFQDKSFMWEEVKFSRPQGVNLQLHVVW